MSASFDEQLDALARLDQALQANAIDYWLFGGWAVDFHAGEITRAHADLDLAVWLTDHERIAMLLVADGWEHAPEGDEDGYTVYQRGPVRLELAFLARADEGQVYTPVASGRARWPESAFEHDVAELAGVRARVMRLGALREDKSQSHGDPAVAAKDRADLITLDRLPSGP